MVDDSNIMCSGVIWNWVNPQFLKQDYSGPSPAKRMAQPRPILEAHEDPDPRRHAKRLGYMSDI